MKNLTGKYSFLLMLILLLPTLVFSAEPGETPTPQAMPAAVEIIPRLGLLNQKIATVQNQLDALKETDSFAKPLDLANQMQQKLAQGIAQFETDGWSFDRLLLGSELVEEQQNNLTELLDSISARLVDLESLRQGWQEQQVFWQQWSQASPPACLKTSERLLTKPTPPSPVSSAKSPRPESH